MAPNQQLAELIFWRINTTGGGAMHPCFAEARKAALRETIRRSFIIGSISATLVFLLYQKGGDSRIFQAP